MENCRLIICCLLFSSLFYSIKCQDENIEEITGNVDFALADATEDEVQFRLFTFVDNIETTGIYDKHNISVFNLNLYIPTRFVIHGWLSNELVSFWYEDLKEEYNRKGSHNIVYVDWSYPASKSYNISSANTKSIGLYLTNFVIAADLNPQLVHLIGYSLGAHVAGFAGKWYQNFTGSKLDRVTLLDAAQPLFKCVEPNSRAADTDANFVDALITDANHYGFARGIGQVNFIANRGRLQPGCPSLEEDDNCSHQRAPIYYAESVNKYSVALRVESAGKFHNLALRERVVFGENTYHQNRGYYIFATRSEAPFLIDSVA